VHQFLKYDFITLISHQWSFSNRKHYGLSLRHAPGCVFSAVTADTSIDAKSSPTSSPASTLCWSRQEDWHGACDLPAFCIRCTGTPHDTQRSIRNWQRSTSVCSILQWWLMTVCMGHGTRAFDGEFPSASKFLHFTYSQAMSFDAWHLFVCLLFGINCQKNNFYNIVIARITLRKQQMSINGKVYTAVQLPLQAQFTWPHCNFGPLSSCPVNNRSTVHLCLYCNEDRWATEHFANLDHMGISSTKCDVVCLQCLYKHIPINRLKEQTWSNLDGK